MNYVVAILQKTIYRKLATFSNWYKSVRILEVLKLLSQQFLNLPSSQRDMSGPIFGDLSNNRWSGVLILTMDTGTVHCPAEIVHANYARWKSALRYFTGQLESLPSQAASSLSNLLYQNRPLH